MMTYFSHVFDVFIHEPKATDAIIIMGRSPRIRIGGCLNDYNLPVATHQDMDSFYESLPVSQREALMKNFATDMSTEVNGIRFRLNIFMQRGTLAVSIRRIPQTSPQLQTRFGDDFSVISDLLRKTQGFIIFSGPSGSGKTSSLASCIDFINENLPYHIVTIEDPIEYLHEPKKSLISQREVGVDVESFFEGLRQSLRESADVIVVGEIRDYKTFDTCIQASETGRLVLTTIHAHNIQDAITRMIGLSNFSDYYSIRCRIAESISAIISQRLIPAGDDRILVHEMVVANKALRNIIREGRENQISTEINMQSRDTLNRKLEKLVYRGIITEQDFKANTVMD